MKEDWVSHYILIIFGRVVPSIESVKINACKS